MEVENAVKKVQLITLGDTQVGKTSILKRFNGEKFSLHTSCTIGIDYVAKECLLGPNKDTKVIVKIWDTAGQERFFTITKGFYKQNQGILVVFDISDRQSFLNVNKWLKNINENAEKNTVKYLIGNKSDKDSERKVSKEEAKTLANKYHMEYQETSAKTNVNIKETIEDMAYKIFMSQGVKKDSMLIPSAHDQEHKSKCKC